MTRSSHTILSERRSCIFASPRIPGHPARRDLCLANRNLARHSECHNVTFPPLYVIHFKSALNSGEAQGVFGSHVVLDYRRSRKQAARFQNLL